MSRKGAVIWLSFVLVFSLIVIIVEIAPVVEAPTTWYVDASNPGPGDGSPGNPFKTTQAGVDNATPGDTVYVYAGIYYENVVVDITLNLTGEDRNTTIINGGGSADTVFISANWVNLTGFTLTGSGPSFGDAGLELDNVHNCSIITLNVSLNWDGISLSSSHYNLIKNNKVTNNTMYGIYLGLSNYNNITGNTMIDNGIFIGGGFENLNTHNIDITNTVNGKPVYYWKNRTAGEIPMGAGQVILSNCTNITISNQELTNGTVGIELGYSSNNNINKNNISSNNRHGIYLHYSDKNLIINNSCLLNQYNGISIWYSNENRIKNNNISNNDYTGIKIYFSNNNIIENNNILSNIGDGVDLLSSNNIINNNTCLLNTASGIGVNSNNNRIENNSCSYNIVGITLWDSDYNIILNNNYSKNNYGIYLFSSANNTIFQNNVTSNTINGIWLDSSSKNKIFHNNIINNIDQADDNSNNGNQWDNGYPSGGNYWSDFDEPSEGAYDDYKGSDQLTWGSDGIVDNGLVAGGGKNPYIIDADSQDNYPLIYPIGNCIFLYEGWNLISIPFIQSDTNLGVVLSSIRGSYDAVQWYNASEIFDPWKHNSIKKPPHLNDLDRIDHTMGFWIHITEPGGVLFEYSGIKPPVNQTITLHKGWNQVGYPSLSHKNRTEALNTISFPSEVDVIWTYNAATQKWKEIGVSDYFLVARGYWIHAKTICVWEVPL